jgi:hypothetical protein
VSLRATVTLKDGRKIESPGIFGLIPIEKLLRILDGESVPQVLRKDLPMPDDLSTQIPKDFIAIPINDAPLDEQRFVSRVIVTPWPIHREFFAGAVLERNDGRWHAYAGVGTDWGSKETPAFLVREPWVRLLGRLICNELAPYVQLADNLGRKADQWIAREVQSRCNYHNQRDLHGFFARA